jgi:hypothetical protein
MFVIRRSQSSLVIFKIIVAFSPLVKHNMTGGSFQMKVLNEAEVAERVKLQEQRRWIVAVLANDEASTDEELVAHFMAEGGLNEKMARYWVGKRGAALRGEL